MPKAFSAKWMLYWRETEGSYLLNRVEMSVARAGFWPGHGAMVELYYPAKG